MWVRSEPPTTVMIDPSVRASGPPHAPGRRALPRPRPDRRRSLARPCSEGLDDAGTPAGDGRRGRLPAMELQLRYLPGRAGDAGAAPEPVLRRSGRGRPE